MRHFVGGGRARICALIVFSACVKAAPPPGNSHGEPAKAPPAPCDRNLSGTYVHESAPAYRYLVTEGDGAKLMLRLIQELDGGEASPVEIVLERGPQGLSGTTHALQPNAQNVPCKVAYPTQITECFDGGIALKTAASVWVDEQCRQVTEKTPPRWTEHRLLRVP